MPNAATTLVSLTPDWVDDFGHFGPLERRLHDEARTAGHAHVALAGRALTPTAMWQVPAFSELAYSSAGPFAPAGRQFEPELRSALDGHGPDASSVQFFYAADVWHLASIVAVASDRPGSRWVVNLMRSAGWIDAALHAPNPWVDSVVKLSKACLAAADRIGVVVTVDTAALAQDVETVIGRPLGRWPMVAIASSRPDDLGRRLPGETMHVVAPVHAQTAKGFPDLVRLAEHTRTALERGVLRLTARWPVDPSPAMVGLAERFERLGGHLVRGNLTDDEFAGLVASADVVLVPYRVRPFRYRTSAVTLDALLAGKPVISVRGTWAGDLVERYGTGITYPEGEAGEMAAAIATVIGGLGRFRRRVAEAYDALAAEHAPENLIAFLLAAPPARRPGPAGEASLAALRILAKQTRDGYGSA